MNEWQSLWNVPEQEREGSQEPAAQAVRRPSAVQASSCWSSPSDSPQRPLRDQGVVTADSVLLTERKCLW